MVGAGEVAGKETVLMSGPYPPQGYPQQPAQGGWGGGQVGGGPSGPYCPASYPGGWQQQQQPQYQQPPQHQDQPGWNMGPSAPEPTRPPRRRNTGQIVIAVIAAVVIIGGVVTGIFLLNNNRQQNQQANSTTTSQPAPATGQQQDTGQAGAANTSGSTNLAVTAGQCVTVTTSGANYVVGRTAQCGTAGSDFILDKTVSQISDCAAHQSVVISGPNGAVYCFTIDVKAGDCVDNNYLKVACGAGAAFTVLKNEAGPGGDTSCRDVTGAQRWVPAGHPAEVACIGPPTN
jgi:hypothetical protein